MIWLIIYVKKMISHSLKAKFCWNQKYIGHKHRAGINFIIKNDFLFLAVETY